MNKWYKIAKNSDTLLKKESDINWKDVGKGLGMGAGLGAGAVGLGLLTNNLPHQKMHQPNQQITQVSTTPTEKIQPKEIKIPQPKQTIEQNQQQQKNIEQEKTELVSDSDLESFISPWEGGARPKAYKDSKGIWTIGVGFNLESPNANAILKQIGSNRESLIEGRSSLNKDQMSKLFKINIKTAVADAKRWIPNLDSQPKEVQMICIDMSFNMGGPTLSQFTTSGKYIVSKNYASAASRLERSAWFGQVGNRSKHHVSVLRNLAKQFPQEEKDE